MFIEEPPTDLKSLDLFSVAAPKMRSPEAQALLQQADDNYWYWDKLRRHKLPPDISHEEVWAYMKVMRLAGRRMLPLTAINRHPFGFSLPDSVLKTLHQIDTCTSDIVGTDLPGHLPTSESYVINSLMEEAIASSQLEGAATTRRVAKDMLRTGRAPHDHSEHMIVNNWQTIQRIRELKQEPLTPALICELHTRMTRNTMPDPKDCGSIRETDDIHVVYMDEIVHTPPPAAFLPERIEQLCAFANDDTTPWIHPVVKASIIHFWMGYDHYFSDGNGRTARALFYWYLLSRKYWLFEYLVISRYFLQSPGQYARAYRYTEIDDDDLTYFIVYSTRIVNAALDGLKLYIRKKQQQLAATHRLLRGYPNLNYRQRELVASALKDPHVEFTFQSHRITNSLSYDTARHDLVGLSDVGLFVKRKVGRVYIFFPSPHINKVLAAA